MINSPSIAKFTAFVELKDFRGPTKKEYVRYLRKLAEHYACDPATLTEDQLRAYFLFQRLSTRAPLRLARPRRASQAATDSGVAGLAGAGAGAARAVAAAALSGLRRGDGLDRPRGAQATVTEGKLRVES